MEWKPDYLHLLRAIRNQGEPGRVPLVELGISKKIKESVLKKKIESLQDEIAFSLYAGYDYIKLQPIVDMNPGKIYPQGEKKQTEVEGSIKWANEHDGVITNERELERYIFPDAGTIDYSRFEAIRNILPKGMTVIGQYGDIFTLVWEMMGMMSFSYALYDQPSLVEKLFEKIGTIVYSMFENMAKMDIVKILWYSDDIAYSTSLMVSPETLHQYFFPWLKKIGDLARKHDKPLIYHSDGKLWQVMDDIVACGVHALHPIEPKAMDIAEVKKRYGQKLCIIGNIDLSYTLTRGTPIEVEAEVKERIKKIAPGGGYCLGSSNSIPDYVKVENFLAMVESCKKYGKYPIG